MILQTFLATLLGPLLPLFGLVFGVFVLQVVWRLTRGWRGELAVALAVRVLGYRALHDVYLPDGRGGLTQVDHLICLPVGIAVIETKAYSGLIFGHARDARWTQVLGRKKYPFQNPLRQNYLHEQAVRALVPADVAVLGHVLFVGSARFRDRPEGVSGLGEFFANLWPARKVPVPPAVAEAWQAVSTAARRDRAARAMHRRQLRDRHSSP